jgi:hypothetical protein
MTNLNFTAKIEGKLGNSPVLWGKQLDFNLDVMALPLKKEMQCSASWTNYINVLL